MTRTEPLFSPEGNEEAVVLSVHQQQHRSAGRMGPQIAHQVLSRLDRVALDLDDDVADLESGLRGRARVLDASH